MLAEQAAETVNWTGAGRGGVIKVSSAQEKLVERSCLPAVYNLNSVGVVNRTVIDERSLLPIARPCKDSSRDDADIL